jgi:homocysteine S-methyltransferase
VILDGGLATELEAQGHDLGGGLWSARLLLEDPDAVAQAHHAFFAAGAEVATTASYQASELSLTRAGYDAALAPSLIRRSVEVARDARDEHGPGGWVAGSVGPYGASLADGSEYTGDYGLGNHEETVEALRLFHRPRIEALVGAGADVLACETVPSLAEVEALAAELGAVGAPSWVSVTTGDGASTRAGDALRDVGAALAGVSGLLAVGVNCCPPQTVQAALRELSAASGLPGVAYPNSGEAWDATAQVWTGQSAWDDDLPASWVAGGARLVGGCCRVTPTDITRVRQHLGA